MDCIVPVTSSMSNLPLETLLAILNMLDAKSMLRCCAVCRLWQETVKSSTELQYTIELWADGLIPGPYTLLTAVQKMARLKEWRDSWASLDWKSRTVFPIMEHPRAYELVAGVFAQQNTWPQSDFSSIRLPSSEMEAQFYSNQNIGLESLDFAMDPTQDFVVFLHKQTDEDIGNFECRSLSNLGPHPRAFSPRQSFGLKDDNFRRIFMQVADDVIGLLFRTTGDLGAPSLRLILYNWREGFPLADLTQFPGSVCDFALISPRAYILACVSHHEYHLGGLGQIHIYTFQDTPDPPRLVATLRLPLLHHSRSLDRIVAHSGPYCANPVSGALFSKSNEQRICVISLAYDRAEFYTVYVHHRCFEKYLKNDGPAPEVVLWDNWGPRNTRLLPGRHLFWLRYVHGERVVCPIDPDHPDRVEILDFGIIPTRPGFDKSTVVRPTTIVSPVDRPLFMNSVTTSLPFRRISRELPGDDPHVLFLLDQDRLIGVNEDVNQLTVYAV
ncbi:F-box domain-containing protein [Favolaschia claudopus]|uniref:F-box domain-containing protein n=1 Tax=Favolaschia claudopus TaxID=2862362 RepID=A0AAW0CHP5_9AGAR